MSTTELVQREQRAQEGIIQFAEEMQAIRDGNLYPGAKQQPDAWKTYCKERWAQSNKRVDDTIRAVPVLKRLATRSAGAHESVSVAAAASVATLPEPVQDAILIESPRRDDASDKAKAVRRVVRAAENEGREATVEEQIAATRTVKPKPKRKRRKHSKFTSNLEQAYWHVEQAADIAQGDTLTDVENDYGWNRVAKIRYQLERVEEKLYRPDVVKDADEEFAELLAGEER